MAKDRDAIVQLKLDLSAAGKDVDAWRKRAARADELEAQRTRDEADLLALQRRCDEVTELHRAAESRVGELEGSERALRRQVEEVMQNKQQVDQYRSPCPLSPSPHALSLARSLPGAGGPARAGPGRRGQEGQGRGAAAAEKGAFESTNAHRGRVPHRTRSLTRR